MRLITYLILTIIGIIIFSLLGFYYSILFPQKIISFPQQPVKLLQTTYRPNDTILFNVPYCKYQDVVGNHVITLENSVILPEYDDVRLLPPGCHTATYPIVLVSATPPGKYRLVLRIEYQVPYLFFAGRKLVYTVFSEEFYVVK